MCELWISLWFWFLEHRPWVSNITLFIALVSSLHGRHVFVKMLILFITYNNRWACFLVGFLMRSQCKLMFQYCMFCLLVLYQTEIQKSGVGLLRTATGYRERQNMKISNLNIYWSISRVISVRVFLITRTVLKKTPSHIIAL